jgi:hypothetical protein
VEEVYTLQDALTFGCACISILPGWWWRSAGGAGSSSHRPARSSGSASKPAIKRVAISASRVTLAGDLLWLGTISFILAIVTGMIG